jgi:Starter unit:ACP transacylase in aflatoxin biosynthesis
MNVHVFGDQTADQTPLLRKIVNRRDNSLLSTFLERSASAVREENQRLPKLQRNSVPDFLTISELVEAYNDSDSKIPQVESVLVTIAQLGHFIGYVMVPQRLTRCG